MPTSVLTSLGQALRWLRERQGRKQYQVADTAGITKGMLSAYETGRQKPSLETLEKLLDTLACDLHDLHNALQIVNGRPQIIRHRTEGPPDLSAPDAGRQDIYQVLGLSQPLPPEEERAISQVLHGFHRLIRYLHETARQPAQALSAGPAEARGSTADGGEGEPEPL